MHHPKPSSGESLAQMELDHSRCQLPQVSPSLPKDTPSPGQPTSKDHSRQGIRTQPCWPSHVGPAGKNSEGPPALQSHLRAGRGVGPDLEHIHCYAVSAANPAATPFLPECEALVNTLSYKPVSESVSEKQSKDQRKDTIY